MSVIVESLVFVPRSDSSTEPVGGLLHDVSQTSALRIEGLEHSMRPADIGLHARESQRVAGRTGNCATWRGTPRAGAQRERDGRRTHRGLTRVACDDLGTHDTSWPWHAPRDPTGRGLAEVRITDPSQAEMYDDIYRLQQTLAGGSLAGVPGEVIRRYVAKLRHIIDDMAASNHLVTPRPHGRGHKIAP